MLLGSITKQSIPDLSVDAMSSTVMQRARSFKLLIVIILFQYDVKLHKQVYSMRKLCVNYVQPYLFR